MEAQTKAVSSSKQSENLPLYKSPDVISIGSVLSVILLLTLVRRKKLSHILGGKNIKFTITVLASMLLLSAIFIAAISEYYMANLGEELTEIAEQDIPLTKLISEAEVQQMHQSIWLERAIIFALQKNKEQLLNAEKHAEQSSKEAVSKLEQALEKVDAVLSKAKNESSTAEFTELKETLTQINEDHKGFDRLMFKKFEGFNQGKIPTLEETLAIEKAEDRLNHSIEEALYQIEKYTLEAGLRAKHMESKAEVKILIFLLGIICVSLSIINIVYRSLTSSLNGSSAQLQDAVGVVDDITGKLKGASDLLKSASEDSRECLAKTTSAMTEITSINQNNFEMLENMSSSVKSIESTIDGASGKVNDMMDSINAIEKANEELSEFRRIIGEIFKETKEINGIVSKTQLLSVNASIEAAKAGDQGRGFSIVAEEVSKLATMSGQRANAINELIDQSINQVEEMLTNSQQTVNSGVEQALQVAEGFSSIRDMLREITQQNEAIYTAAQEQTTGIRSISSSLTEIQSTTEKEFVVARTVTDFSERLNDVNGDLQSTTSHILKMV